jgi:hypothetical protein
MVAKMEDVIIGKSGIWVLHIFKELNDTLY